MASAKVMLSRSLDSCNVSKKGVSRIGDLGLNEVPLQKKRKLSHGVWDVEDDVDGVIEGRSSLTEEDDLELGQLDEEDSTRAHNISCSRWAMDDDAEMGNDELVVRREERKKSSSPESGVTEKDESGRDESYESDYEDEEYMEIDGEKCEIASESDSDCEIGSPVSGRRNMLLGCRSVFDFERLGKISEGSYGIVHKARDKVSGDIVALKKLKMDKDDERGFPVHFLREINTLLALNHPSIVNVREVVVDDNIRNGFDNIFMVMDYVEHDLKELLKLRKHCFSQSEVKSLMIQLLEGVKYLHDNWILHRDLKTSNLLVNEKGQLKICDFGMARQYGSSPLKPYTSLVVTLWYRCPELLLGAEEYSTAVDMWSVGCIMAELLTNKPLFDGKTEVEQINKIFKTLGTPKVDNWPGYSKLPGSKLKHVHQPNNLLHKLFPRTLFTGSPVLSDSGLDLLSRFLAYDPEKRITAEEALNHRWFQEVPHPTGVKFTPSFSDDKRITAEEALNHRWFQEVPHPTGVKIHA